LAGPEGEQSVREEIIDVLSPFRQSNGSYQLRNEFHFVIARA
jgi:hypothetical protein